MAQLTEASINALMWCGNGRMPHYDPDVVVEPRVCTLDPGFMGKAVREVDEVLAPRIPICA
jgi:hypothetical protein